MGENSTTLDDQVGSPRVVPTRRFAHILSPHTVFPHPAHFRSLQAHHVTGAENCDFAILRQYRET